MGDFGRTVSSGLDEPQRLLEAEFGDGLLDGGAERIPKAGVDDRMGSSDLTVDVRRGDAVGERAADEDQRVGDPGWFDGVGAR